MDTFKVLQEELTNVANGIKEITGEEYQRIKTLKKHPSNW